jgi:flagellar biosynthetic protein FliS
MNASRWQAAGAEYWEGRVLSADPKQLVLFLYEKVLDETVNAARFLESNDPMARSAAVSKAMEGLSELTSSLDMEQGGTHAERLRDLYGFLHSELLAAHAGQSRERFDSAAKILEILCNNWRETCALLDSASAAAPPVSENEPLSWSA